MKSVVTKSLQTGLLDLQGFISVGSDIESCLVYFDIHQMFPKGENEKLVSLKLLELQLGKFNKVLVKS